LLRRQDRGKVRKMYNKPKQRKRKKIVSGQEKKKPCEKRFR